MAFSSFSSHGQSLMSPSSPERKVGTTHEKTCKFTHSCAANVLLATSTSALVPYVTAGGDVEIAVRGCESELGVANSAVSKNGAFLIRVLICVSCSCGSGVSLAEYVSSTRQRRESSIY